MCHSCVSSSPEFPPLPSWEGPAAPKGPPGEGAAVSFLRKQESSGCHSCASGNPEKNNWIPAFAAMTYKGAAGSGFPRPANGRTRRLPSENPLSFGFEPIPKSGLAQGGVDLSWPLKPPCFEGSDGGRHFGIGS